jgi:hypothetical protein
MNLTRDDFRRLVDIEATVDDGDEDEDEDEDDTDRGTSASAIILNLPADQYPA